jgi:hypothetical protein
MSHAQTISYDAASGDLGWRGNHRTAISAQAHTGRAVVDNIGIIQGEVRWQRNRV